ncbi:nucleotidyltransferase family protein [Carboxylicivirga linearis]|uniref:Nucleotidyltransferase domain-containing protein n=1 Tax=Carboxylicivirga linearis TaxID=1628157 RepID=A0ABS5JPF8_9BACT|nr:nucleotidyltransferase domain-containing protein [Carboxylicivirga linearis]MBS2096793.1 nucleotidyltransferase domain-containing protein [Carboxylicivirga linearis]
MDKRKAMYLDKYINEIHNLCREHKVKTLYAFGSVLTDKFGPNSDIDLVIEINSNDPIDYAENYFDFKFKLQELINKPIDLIEEKGIKNSHLKSNIESSKFKIYEA